jgi:hypothetical protein
LPDVSAEAFCARFHKPLPRERAVMLRTGSRTGTAGPCLCDAVSRLLIFGEDLSRDGQVEGLHSGQGQGHHSMHRQNPMSYEQSCHRLRAAAGAACVWLPARRAASRFLCSGNCPDRNRLPAGRQCPLQLAARGDTQLREHLAQVVLDRARADEQPGTDLRVGQAAPGQPRDLGLLLRQCVAGGKYPRPGKQRRRVPSAGAALDTDRASQKAGTYT